MPAALDVNWEAIEMLALEVGVREAARRLGISEEAVMKRSSRKGWIKDRPASVPPPPTMVVREDVRAVRNAAEELKNALAERGNKSRMSVAKGLGAAADAIGEMNGLEVLEASKSVKNVVNSLATVHAWNEAGAMIKMNLNLTAQSQEGVTLDAEIVQPVEGEELP